MENISLTRYLDQRRILLLTEISSKKRVFELLGEILVDGLDNVQAAHVTAELQARERLGTTALGEGVAIPHCRLENIDQIRCAIIKLDHPVDFDAPDGNDVSIICALVVPNEATEEHLQMLASLAEFLSKPSNRESLRNCKTAQELQEIFTESFDKHAA